MYLCWYMYIHDVFHLRNSTDYTKSYKLTKVYSLHQAKVFEPLGLNSNLHFMKIPGNQQEQMQSPSPSCVCLCARVDVRQ